jgi:hypothetical protein
MTETGSMAYLLQAIMTKMAGSALSSDVNGRIYLDEAPHGAEFPYVVFLIVSGVPENLFAQKGDIVTVQFSLFSISRGLAEITDMYGDLIALFDDISLTITGDTCINMARENLMTMVEDIGATPNGNGTVRHWAVDYSIHIED